MKSVYIISAIIIVLAFISCTVEPPGELDTYFKDTAEFVLTDPTNDIEVVMKYFQRHKLGVGEVTISFKNEKSYNQSFKFDVFAIDTSDDIVFSAEGVSIINLGPGKEQVGAQFADIRKRSDEFSFNFYTSERKTRVYGINAE